MYTNEAIAGLVPKTKEVSNKYLFHLFNNKIIDLDKDNFNTFGKSLNSKFLKEELKIPLPPKDIQERIVKECEDVDKELIEKENKIKKLKNKIIQEFGLMSGDIFKLGDVVSVISGGTPKRDIGEYWQNGTINWLKSEVCQNNYVYEHQVKEKITKLGLEKSSAKVLNKNTVLIALVGATIGKVGYLTFKTTINQNIAGLYPLDENILLPKYLYYLCKKLYPEFMKLGEGKFSMANLTFIKNLKVKIPKNINLQKQVVKKIETLENEIRIAQNNIDNAKNKKEEILKKYL